MPRNIVHLDSYIQGLKEIKYFDNYSVLTQNKV